MTKRPSPTRVAMFAARWGCSELEAQRRLEEEGAGGPPTNGLVRCGEFRTAYAGGSFEVPARLRRQRGAER